MFKKLMIAAGIAGLLAGCATQAPSSGVERNAPGGKIAQFTDGFKGKVTWQIVQPDAASCQKFVALFDSKPDVLKYAVDCWLDSDNESASLPVRLTLQQKSSGKSLQLEAADAAACAQATDILKESGDYVVTSACPAPAAKK